MRTNRASLPRNRANRVAVFEGIRIQSNNCILISTAFVVCHVGYLGVTGVYYVFRFAIRVSDQPSVCHIYISPGISSSFCFVFSITEMFINRFHSNFEYAFLSRLSRLGL